jgi:hypothetical protein
MAHVRNEKLIMITTVGGFVLAFVINALGAMVYPPDMSGEFPVYNSQGVMIIQFAGAFLIIALTVIAMKAEEERQILAAAGFTAMAISFGISVLSIFDIADIVTFAQYERYYRITVSSNFLFIPALLLISTYHHFKRWIRYASFLAGVPFAIASVMFLSGVRDYALLENIVNVGVGAISLCWVFWAINVYLNYKKGQVN